MINISNNYRCANDTFLFFPNPRGSKKVPAFNISPFDDEKKKAENCYLREYPIINAQRVLMLFIGLIALTFSSCQPNVLNNLAKVEQEIELKANPIVDIAEGEEKTFRAKVKGFNQEMSGLLVAKRMDTSYRFVMVTDFGLKVFDFSLNENGDNEFHHIMKHMDYEFLKNSLVLNLLMLLPVNWQDKVEVYQKDDFVVYAPHDKMLYFVKDEKINRVQRFKGKRSIWAEALLSGKNIEIEQNKPEIVIRLKSL